MIYFVQAKRSGMVKIGYSGTVKSRLKALQTSSPEPLVVLAVIEGTLEDEKNLHRRFAHERRHGEWFFPSERLLRFVQRQASDARKPAARNRIEQRRQRRSDASQRLAKPATFESLRSPDEIADVLGVAASTVIDWAQRGELPHFKIGGRLRFRLSEVAWWLAQRRKHDGGPPSEAVSTVPEPAAYARRGPA